MARRASRTSYNFIDRSPEQGFTIVELLIVIVVIGILAAITVVAFNGVQGRAHDAAVKTDLRSAGSLVQQHIAVAGTDVPPESLDQALTGFRASHSAYASNNNLIYCADANSRNFGFGARTRNGKSFVYSSSGGLRELTETLPIGSAAACPVVLGSPHTSFAWGWTSGAWASWAD